MSVRVVQGFGVFSFTGKNETVSLVLKGAKDDIRAGEGDISDVLESLELHSTASDTSTVSVALRNSDGEASTSYEFTVESFNVNKESIKITLKTQTSDETMSVLTALGRHAAADLDENVVELTMQRPD